MTIFEQPLAAEPGLASCISLSVSARRIIFVALAATAADASSAPAGCCCRLLLPAAAASLNALRLGRHHVTRQQSLLVHAEATSEADI